MDEVTKQQKEPIIIGGMEFIHVPGGEFDMGDVFGDGFFWQKPVHRVILDSFYIGKYPVTSRQYDIYLEATGKIELQMCLGQMPVTEITWYDAAAYCKWLSEKTGEEIRLPTEAEWEYAARECGKKIKWSGTDNKDEVNQVAWHTYNSKQKEHPVGEKKPNGLGLFDMSGNVWEWCADWYDEHYYARSPERNPKGPSSGEYRALRGGSWGCVPESTQCHVRREGEPDDKGEDAGFRCVRIK